jgi:hypothetical protein
MPAGGSAAAAVAVRKKKEAQAAKTQTTTESTTDVGPSNSEAVVADPDTWHAKLAVALHQEEARASYQNPVVQWAIAGLIMGNFISNCVEKELDPFGVTPGYGSDYWYPVELTWNIIFVIELVWNMWGCWYWKVADGHFLLSGWNLFDFFVVAVSIPSMIGIELPPPANNLRIFRAFRVFRLFKRIKSLNKILVSLAKAVPGIINAAMCAARPPPPCPPDAACDSGVGRGQWPPAALREFGWC